MTRVSEHDTEICEDLQKQVEYWETKFVDAEERRLQAARESAKIHGVLSGAQHFILHELGLDATSYEGQTLDIMDLLIMMVRKDYRD